MKDWQGNKPPVWITNGCSNHSEFERVENDYYATEPKAAELLLEVEPNLDNIWECACGEGHLAKVFNRHCKLSLATDLINRGYGSGVVDFLISGGGYKDGEYFGDIVTNPPYIKAKEFVEKALSLVKDGRKVCMFLKLTFLEGKSRKELFKKYPPKTVYVASSRLNCVRNGEFEKYPSSAVAYAWFVWEKGYKGETVVKWIN